MKTNTGAKKRFKLTGTGAIKRKKANRKHILTSKSRKRKRQLRQDALVHPADMNNVLHALALR